MLGISAGFGITAIHATEVVDYLNSVESSRDRLDEVASAPEFFGSVEVRLDESWGAKAEYSYLLKTYTVNTGAFRPADYTYRVHMPTVMLQYILADSGYAFKFGTGIGYHTATLAYEQVQGGPQQLFHSTGWGLTVEAEGNTTLGGSLFAYLACDVRGNSMSTFKDQNGATLSLPRGQNKNASMSFFSVGFKLGLMYYFW